MQLVWLRNDLRLDDNPALFYACEKARQTGQPVRAVYCATPSQWQQHDEAPAKLGLRSDALSHLQKRLAVLGIGLELLSGDTFAELPQVLAAYCREHKVEACYFNCETPLDEQRRDRLVSETLSQLGISCHSYEADLLVDPEQLRTGQGGYYKVFTPWYRAWLQRLPEPPPEPLPAPEPVAAPLPTPGEPIHLPGSGDYRRDLWAADEASVLERLQTFCDERLYDYPERRDIPSINGTSTLSPYLASGLVSPRHCLQVIRASYPGHSSWRGDPWLRELAWREFYRYLMRCFPQLSRGEPFKPETRLLQWEQDDDKLRAWQQGQTGYPIIDAAMRQLERTGWMHNRLRMLTASFLTKLLLQDWHKGEAFFMQQLLDGDFPSNNGGWQWSASTGCDASPWFRVFNPTRQSQKFDPEGKFIRKLVPELAGLDNKSIHDPPAAVREQLGYPAPVVDYSLARARVLERFRALNDMQKQD